MEWLATVLDNKSAAAFLGALFGFLLVIVNDWRRERRKVGHIRTEIELNQVVARNKLETVRGNRAMIRDNRITAAPILKFSSGLIRQMAAEVLSRLTPDQRRSLEALCYRMEAIDELLADAYIDAKKFEPPSELSEEQRQAFGKRLIDKFGDAIVNLKILDGMAAHYLNGHYTEIVATRYDAAKFEEE